MTISQTQKLKVSRLKSDHEEQCNSMFGEQGIKSIEAFTATINYLLTVNDNLKPFESCSERKVPVIEYGSKFIQNCQPSIESLSHLQ